MLIYYSKYKKKEVQMNMKTKKLIALALALCLLLTALAACGGSGDKNNTLKVATSPDFAPMAFVDTSKQGQEQYVGFDMMLAKYIADEMGKELVIQPMSFDACTTAVDMGTVDMAVSGFSWKQDREDNYNLSDFYYPGDNESEQVVITMKENEGKFTSAADFAGVKVGAQTASLQESLCQEQLPDCEIVTIGDLGTGLLQLKNGDFEAMAVAAGQAEVFMANDPNVALSGFEFEVDEKYTANVIVMKKGNDDLTKQVNDILKKAYDSGVYGQWYEEAKELAMSATANEVSFDDEGNAPAGEPGSEAESEAE